MKRSVESCVRVWTLMAGAIALFFAGHGYAGSHLGKGYFPNVRLVTQDGVPVHFYDDLLKGKSVAINVIYTSCKDECPLETARMAQVQQLLGARMGKDIFFYSISIDPEHDTPQVLKDYAAKFGAGPGWLFLTGNRKDIALLAKKLGLSRSSDAVSRDGHASSLMIGHEPTGQWMRNSAVDNPQFLAATMSRFFGWKDGQPARNYAEARPLDISGGQYLYQSKCSACHTIGGGDSIGPDLAGVTVRRERAWLTRYLAEPDKMLSEGDPIATRLFNQYNKVRMPNLQLGRSDVAALLSYLEERGKVREVQEAPQARKESAHHHHHH